MLTYINQHQQGNSTGSYISANQLTIKDIDGLKDEIESLKADNTLLKEWLNHGKYSAK